MVMIQDTRYKPRKDDTPQLKIHGYHTYHIPVRPKSHGLVTIVKKTQFHQQEHHTVCLVQARSPYPLKYDSLVNP